MILPRVTREPRWKAVDEGLRSWLYTFFFLYHYIHLQSIFNRYCSFLNALKSDLSEWSKVDRLGTARFFFSPPPSLLYISFLPFQTNPRKAITNHLNMAPGEVSIQSTRTPNRRENGVQGLNKYSKAVTQDPARGGAQAMLHAAGLTVEDLEKVRIGNRMKERGLVQSRERAESSSRSGRTRK